MIKASPAKAWSSMFGLFLGLKQRITLSPVPCHDDVLYEVFNEVQDTRRRRATCVGFPGYDLEGVPEKPIFL